ncbi:MAG TPA: cysteine hydrolase, partial [Chloroflexota bacterium]|nr:cysteine hydrolase [Chloroflexota bacterium]
MAAKNDDLHGNVPDESDVALLLIDVINDMEYPGGDRLFAHALPMAERLAALVRRAREAGV